MGNEAQSGDRIEAAAIDWFVRRQSGTWSEADEADLADWLNASSAHRIQYIRVATTWSHTARLKALGAGVSPGAIPPRGQWGGDRFCAGGGEEHRPAPHGQPDFAGGSREVESSDRFTVVEQAPRRIRRGLWAVAATLILALASGVYGYYQDSFAGEHYTTKVGGLNTVPLADGSRVTLNTDSDVRVLLGKGERRIRLDRGEAFFEVAKDEARPFIVYAGAKRVIAVGTKFSVRRDGDGIQVVVSEGRVRLAAIDEVLTAPAHDATPTGSSNPDTSSAISRPTFLDAGSVAEASESEVSVHEDARPRVEQLLAWRSGYVAFQDTPLADAVAEFNRYSTRRIYIDDAAVGAIRVGGNFRSNNLAAFLDLLATGFPIDVEQFPDRIVLKSR